MIRSRKPAAPPPTKALVTVDLKQVRGGDEMAMSVIRN